MGEIKHLINITDLTVEEIDHLMETADDIIAHPENYWDACAHKKLATLFFEPSTRTRLSFTAAMMELAAMCWDSTRHSQAPRQRARPWLTPS